MLGGWIMGTIGVWVLALARDWVQLLPGLILYGLSAYCLPAITAYVTHAEARGDLGRALTTVWAAYPAGQVISPAIGGAMAQALGMRTVFITSGVIFCLSTLLVSRIAHQTVEPRADNGDYNRLLRNRSFVMLSGLFLFMFTVSYLGQPLAPNYLEEVTGLPVSWIGTLGSASSLGAAVLAVVLGRLPWSNRARLAANQGLMALSMAAFLSSSALPVLAVSFFLRGSWNAARALASAELATRLEPSTLGLGYGVLNTVVGTATIVAPYLAGWLYTTRADLPFLAALVGTTGTLVLTFLVLPGSRVAPSDQQSSPASS
jgi:MFS family permease